MSICVCSATLDRLKTEGATAKKELQEQVPKANSNKISECINLDDPNLTQQSQHRPRSKAKGADRRPFCTVATQAARLNRLNDEEENLIKKVQYEKKKVAHPINS
jgi:hypothetical protein